MTAELFKKRFVRIYPKLFAVAVANMGNREDAKDIMQSLYLKLWERRDELAGIDNDIGYCRVMLLNICRSRWRSKALEPEWAAEEEANVIDDLMLQGIEANDIKEKVEQFVTRLPEKQRCIMTMRMHGATTDEIIEATGLSVENVRTILSRSRQLIREYYNKINS